MKKKQGELDEEVENVMTRFFFAHYCQAENAFQSDTIDRCVLQSIEEACFIRPWAEGIVCESHAPMVGHIWSYVIQTSNASTIPFIWNFQIKNSRGFNMEMIYQVWYSWRGAKQIAQHNFNQICVYTLVVRYEPIRMHMAKLAAPDLIFEEADGSNDIPYCKLDRPIYMEQPNNSNWVLLYSESKCAPKIPFLTLSIQGKYANLPITKMFFSSNPNVHSLIRFWTCWTIIMIFL